MMVRRSQAKIVIRLVAAGTIGLVTAGPRPVLAQTNAASAVASAASAAPLPGADGLFDEPGLVAKAIALADTFGEGGGESKSGFYPELSNMITGSGWVSLGPGYRRYFANDRAMVETSGAISWRMYKMGQVRFELPDLADGHLVLGTQALWQDSTQVNYFGVGPDVPEENRSQYRLQSHDVVGYAVVTTKPWLSVTGKFGRLGTPKFMDPGGTFLGDFPSTRDAFPTDPAVSLDVQPAFLHSEASIAADTRDHRGHPMQGGLYRAALMNYWDRRDGVFTFHTWEAEALHYIPVAESRLVFVLHGWTVAGDAGADHEIPAYLLPTIGGSRTLRAYGDFQFHDRKALVFNAESRVALFTHLDAALFVDAGSVARRFGDLNLDKQSYGAGLRLHNVRTTLGRFDVAHGRQGWQMTVATSEPMRLPRVRRTTASVPFTP